MNASLTASSQNSTNNTSSKRRKTLNNSIFHIRLGNHINKVDIKDPVFRRILEQQYATKYLQSMGVQATSKNITKILKERPLDSCQIVQSRLTGGLHTDTITIITKSQIHNNENNAKDDQHVSNDMLKILDLRKMALKRDSKQVYKASSIVNNKKSQSVEQNSQNLSNLSFSPKKIKERYIFPFNENFSRKSHYKMKDVGNIVEGEREDNKLIFESPIFHFPFTQIKLSLKILRQLQSPINAKFNDISEFLQKFYQNFPQNIIPIKKVQEPKKHNFADKLNYQSNPSQEKSHEKRPLQSDIYISFLKQHVDKMFDLIKSDENVKFIGVFMHLSYWSVFGGVNPVQIDLSTKKKMFLMISQTIEYFELKTENKRIWMSLVKPMILLTLKMALDYFYHEGFPKLFLSEEALKVKANEIAYDKLLLFVEKNLDQGNINGRFVFLESDIDGPKGNFVKDKKYIRKRIFGTSPGLHLILPEPKDGKTRCIMAKNTQIDQQEGILQENCHTTFKPEDRQCREKLLNLALLKIRSRIDQFTGSTNDINPIIKLNDKQ